MAIDFHPHSTYRVRTSDVQDLLPLTLSFWASHSPCITRAISGRALLLIATQPPQPVSLPRWYPVRSIDRVHNCLIIGYPDDLPEDLFRIALIPHKTYYGLAPGLSLSS